MTDLPPLAQGKPDTPILPQSFPPPSRLDQIKGFVGDLARPLAIIITAVAAGLATVTIAFRVTSFGEGAIFIGAVFAGLGALFGVKGWENNTQTKQAAQVEIAKASTPGA